MHRSILSKTHTRKLFTGKTPKKTSPVTFSNYLKAPFIKNHLRKCISTELLQFVAASQSLTKFKKKDLPAVEEQKEDSDSECESSSSYTTTTNEDGEFEDDNDDDESVDEIGVRTMMKEVNFGKYPNSLSFKDRLYNDNLVVETLYERPKSVNPKEVNTNESSKKVKDIHVFSSENSSFMKNHESKKSSNYLKCFSFNSSAASLPSKLTPVTMETPSAHHPSFNQTPITFSSINETEDSVFEKTKKELKLRTKTETSMLNDKAFHSTELDPKLLDPFDSKEQHIFKNKLKGTDPWNSEFILKTDNCSEVFKKDNIDTYPTKRQKVFSFEPSFHFNSQDHHFETLFSNEKKSSVSNEISEAYAKCDKHFDNLFKNDEKNFEKEINNVFSNKVYAIESPHFFGIKNRSKSRERHRAFSPLALPFVSFEDKQKSQMISHTKKSSERLFHSPKKHSRTRGTKKRKLSSKSRLETINSAKKCYFSEGQTCKKLSTFNQLVQDSKPLDGFFTDHEGYNSESTALDPFLSKSPLCEDHIKDIPIFEEHKITEKKNVNKSLQTLPVELVEIPTKAPSEHIQEENNVEEEIEDPKNKTVMDGIKEKFSAYNREVFKKGYKPSTGDYEMVLKKVLEESERKLELKPNLAEEDALQEDFNLESISSNIGEINADLKNFEKTKSKKAPQAKKFFDPSRGLVPQPMPPGMLGNGLPSGSQRVVHNYLETGGLSATSSVASIDHPNKDNDIKEVMDLENYISPVLMEKHKIRNEMEKNRVTNNGFTCLSAACHKTPSRPFTVSPFKNSSLSQNCVTKNIPFSQNKIPRNPSLPHNNKMLSNLPIYKDSSDDDDAPISPQNCCKPPVTNRKMKNFNLTNAAPNFHQSQNTASLKASLQNELASLQQNHLLNSKHFDENHFEGGQHVQANEKCVDQTEVINRSKMYEETNYNNEKKESILDGLMDDDQLKKERLMILKEIVELKKLREIRELTDLKEWMNLKGIQNKQLMQELNKKKKLRDETSVSSSDRINVSTSKQKKSRKKEETDSNRSLSSDSGKSACHSKEVFNALRGVLEMTKYFKKDKKQAKRRKKCNRVSSIDSFESCSNHKRVVTPPRRPSYHKEFRVHNHAKKEDYTVDTSSQSDKGETKKVLEKLMELTKKINSFELTKNINSMEMTKNAQSMELSKNIPSREISKTMAFREMSRHANSIELSKKEATSVNDSDSFMSTPIFSKANDYKHHEFLNKSNSSPMDSTYIHHPYSQYTHHAYSFNNNLPIDFSTHSFRQCNNSCDEVTKHYFPFVFTHDALQEPLNLSTDETTNTSQQNIQLKAFTSPCTSQYEKALMKQPKIVDLNKAHISVDSQQFTPGINEKTFKFEYSIEANDSYPKLKYPPKNILPEACASLSMSDLAIVEHTSNDPHEMNNNDLVVNRCASHRNMSNEDLLKISERGHKGNFMKVVDCSRFVSDVAKFCDSEKTLIMLESSLAGMVGHPNRVASTPLPDEKDKDVVRMLPDKEVEQPDNKNISKESCKKNVEIQRQESVLKKGRSDHKDEKVDRESKKVDSEKNEKNNFEEKKADDEEKKKEVKSVKIDEEDEVSSETHTSTHEWLKELLEPCKQQLNIPSCKELFQKQQSILSCYKNRSNKKHSSSNITETSSNKVASTKSDNQNTEKLSKCSVQSSSSSVSQASKNSTAVSEVSKQSSAKEHISNMGSCKQDSKTKTSHSTLRETIGNYFKKLPKPRLKASKTVVDKKAKDSIVKPKVSFENNDITPETSKEYKPSTEAKVRKFYEGYSELDSLNPPFSFSQDMETLLEHNVDMTHHKDPSEFTSGKPEGGTRKDFDWISSLKRNDSVLQERSLMTSNKETCDSNEFIDTKQKILVNLQKFKQERESLTDDVALGCPGKFNYMKNILEDNFIKDIVNKYDMDMKETNFSLKPPSPTFRSQTFFHRDYRTQCNNPPKKLYIDGYYDNFSPRFDAGFKEPTNNNICERNLEVAMNKMEKSDEDYKDYFTYVRNDLSGCSIDAGKQSIIKPFHTAPNIASLQPLHFDCFYPTDGASEKHELTVDIRPQHTVYRQQNTEPAKHIKLYGEKKTQTSKNSLVHLNNLEIQTSQKLLNIYMQQHREDNNLDSLSHVTTLKEEERPFEVCSIASDKNPALQKRDAISESMLERAYMSSESFRNNPFNSVSRIPEKKCVKSNEKEPLCNEIEVTNKDKKKLADASKSSNSLFDDQNLSGFMKLCIESKKNYREVPNFLEERASSENLSFGDWESKPPYVTSSLCSAIKCVSRQERCRDVKNTRNLCPNYIPKFCKTINSNFNNHNNSFNNHNNSHYEDTHNNSHYEGTNNNSHYESTFSSADETQGSSTTHAEPLQHFPIHPPKMHRKNILYLMHKHLHHKFWEHIFKHSSSLGRDISSYVNLVDPWNGQSMLTEAVLMHEWVTVDNLMWLGAILDLEDHKGRSSFSMATSLNDQESIRLHFKHGLILDDLRFLKLAKFYLKGDDNLYEYLRLLFNCGWEVSARFRKQVLAALEELKRHTKRPVSQMITHIRTPPSLQLICRSSIRKHLRRVTNHRSICDVTLHLPLPPPLKTFILSTNLHIIK